MVHCNEREMRESGEKVHEQLVVTASSPVILIVNWKLIINGLLMVGIGAGVSESGSGSLGVCE